jgi:hypothetical protein
MNTHPTTPTGPSLTGAVLYADVTCPACLLASLRTDLLAARGADVPQWRFVEHRPGVRVSAVSPDDETQSARERELAAVLSTVRPAEPLDDGVLPTRVPRLLPSTSAAATAYAEAVNAGVGDVARRLLFGAYWLDGLDIGTPNLLRALLMAPLRHAIAQRRHDARPRPARTSRWSGSAEVVAWTGNVVSITGGPITAAGERLVCTWRQERAALEAPACLTMLTATGQVLSGAAALDLLVLPDHLLAGADDQSTGTTQEPPLAAAG